VKVKVGTIGGVKEHDILPWKGQRLFGPERPSFCPLVTVMKLVVEMLGECTQLNRLTVDIGSGERRSGSVELLLGDLRRLRGVTRADVIAYSIKEELNWVH
jgi:hypothetical protein